VAVVFLAGFAFWEVSFTIIVIVHFLIWKVIRIDTTSYWRMEITACV